jgi:arylsulfatase A-like enzyme
VNKALDRGVSFLCSDYVAILEHMDHNIGRLVDLLEDLGVAENTLIVFVSDNGACNMGDDTAGTFPGNNGPFRGGKATTYQGELNVPFVMNWKGRLPQGMVSDAGAMHRDVSSTLLDAAGISVPKMNGKNAIKRDLQAGGEGDSVLTDEEAQKWNTPGFKQANSMGGGEATISKLGKLRVFVLMGVWLLDEFQRRERLSRPAREEINTGL